MFLETDDVQLLLFLNDLKLSCGELLDGLVCFDPID